jgi:type II secretory pathway pseudopilin PulG
MTFNLKFKSRNFLTGFTLLETLMVVIIFGLMITVLASLIVSLYRTHTFTLEQSEAIEEARRGIEIMVKEIRGARTADDGSFPIEKADDKEFIFYSDIDGDGQVERVRYFLGNVSSGSQTSECQTSLRGGSCSVTFNNFLRGTLISAQVRISLDGDLGASNEYVDVSADGRNLARLCQTGCTDCPGAWQGTSTFDVTDQARDGAISFSALASSRVDPACPHAMKAKFEFSWSENLAGLSHEFRKGVIKPQRDVGGRVIYPREQEQIQIISSYVRNSPPIFTYFDQNGNVISNYPARLVDTKMMKLFLVINVEPNRPPQDFELESYVQLRNLKGQ